MQDPNNPQWTPPPPPDDSVFGGADRQHFAEEIRTSANKALVYGILSIFCCPPIFAYLGFTTAQEVITNIEIHQVEEGKRALAQTAKVLSIVGIVLWILGMIARFTILA